MQQKSKTLPILTAENSIRQRLTHTLKWLSCVESVQKCAHLQGWMFFFTAILTECNKRCFSLFSIAIVVQKHLLYGLWMACGGYIARLSHPGPRKKGSMQLNPLKSGRSNPCLNKCYTYEKLNNAALCVQRMKEVVKEGNESQQGRLILLLYRRSKLGQRMQFHKSCWSRRESLSQL